MKILIMGLPGAGKTWLAERLHKYLNAAWYNADKVRDMANDWDFSDAGRLRQANRMKHIADFEKSVGRTVICDFVCPTEKAREMFDADLTVWVDTIKEGRFDDTNKIFEKPELIDFHVVRHLSDAEIENLGNMILEKFYD